MPKRARQRISYVLEPPNSSPGGHRLGVNGLAVDRDNAILYSGGRDGVVCAWDINLDLRGGAHHHASVVDTTPPSPFPSSPPSSAHATRFRRQTQAHTHWINDIALAQQHTAIVTASSDLLVKLWRPLAAATAEPATIGQHADYVKCVVTPHQAAGWAATGGLDRTIAVWDLAGAGRRLAIDASGRGADEEDAAAVEKGSVYALAATASVLASGGPEGTVRLWDPKSGQRIAKFVGHTDVVRALLVSEAGDVVLSASADQTVKAWSVTAGRCVATLTMHSDSVWALFAADPALGVFYSGDRSGLVAKTDVRATAGEWDSGLSLAVAQEQDGVSRLVACGDYIWTATSRSSINRWVGVDTADQGLLPEGLRLPRASVATGRSGQGSSVNGVSKKGIPVRSILRISNTTPFPPVVERDAEQPIPALSRKGSDMMAEPVTSVVEPIHDLPEETVEGQFGLVKHRLLNDRRRVLTLDTAGDVLLWDLIQCKPVQSFGKKHLEDVEPLVNTLEAVAPWCSIDTSSGNLTVILEPFNCFHAEMYADELSPDEFDLGEFRDDQRINLGSWVLRWLFDKLIEEEIRRDEVYRAKLNESVEKRLAAAAARANPPSRIPLPQPFAHDGGSARAPTTPKAKNGPGHHHPTTPGLAIGLATPAPPPPPLPGVPEGGATPVNQLNRQSSPISRLSVEKDDYFANAIHSVESQTAVKAPQTPAVDSAEDKAPKTPLTENAKDKDKDNGKAHFGKKFRMGMSFGSKKLGRSASQSAVEKPAVVDERAEESETSSTTGGGPGADKDGSDDDNFQGGVQTLRRDYDRQLTEAPDRPVASRIAPAPPNDAPRLPIPPGTRVILQEETSGGSAELYRGTVATTGADADDIEARGPRWLADVLLVNALPPKEPVKVSFVLHPWPPPGGGGPGALPPLVAAAADGNSNSNTRLNANRMLRVKKILAYVAERIDPPPEDPNEADPNALRPEEYLELYCNDQLLPVNMSLATLRAHVWKGGNDVLLYYRANGRKQIPMAPLPPRPPRAESDAGNTESVQQQPAVVAAA